MSEVDVQTFAELLTMTAPMLILLGSAAALAFLSQIPISRAERRLEELNRLLEKAPIELPLPGSVGSWEEERGGLGMRLDFWYDARVMLACCTWIGAAFLLAIYFLQ